MSSLVSSFQQYLPAVSIILLPNVGSFVTAFGLGAFLSSNDNRNREWYNTLKKPSFNPPNWVFGPAWTCIYACMGVSSYLIFKQGGFEAQTLPLALYGTQLLLNWAWSPIFFKYHRIGLALIDIVALWTSIAATTYVFYPISSTAALLMLPHLGWVSFATLLNFSIWRLNGRGTKAIKAE